MIDLNKISGKWLKKLKIILANFPAEYLKVEELCAQKNYKEAFMFTSDFLRNNKIPVTDDYEESSKDLYFSLR